jgi:hypothetical protein
MSKHGSWKSPITSELYFYSEVFGFEFTEEIEPILIENL